MYPDWQVSRAPLSLRADVRWALLRSETDEDAAYRLEETPRKELLGLLRLLGIDAADAPVALQEGAVGRLVRAAAGFSVDDEEQLGEDWAS